jgi:hypothetical protein
MAAARGERVVRGAARLCHLLPRGPLVVELEPLDQSHAPELPSGSEQWRATAAPPGGIALRQRNRLERLTSFTMARYHTADCG